MSSDKREIWKQVLGPGLQTYQLPADATVVSVGLQRGKAVLWYMCDPARTATAPREILLTGTGHAFDNASWLFYGTMMTDDQTLVFHVLEKTQ